MKSKESLVPVKKVLRMINSCQDQKQIDNCKLVVNNYVKSAKKHGIVNINDLQDRLDEDIIQRQEQLYLVNIFQSEI